MHIFLVLSAFVAALISGAAGFGGALLLLPAVTLFIGADKAVPTLAIAQLLGNLSRMVFGWKEIKWRPALLFMATAVPLSALGAFGFASLPQSLISRIIGLALIAFAALKLFGKLEFKPGKAVMLGGGAATGLLSGLAGSAGPIGAAVFLSLGLAPVAYVASEASTAAAMHITKILVYKRLMGLSLDAALIGLEMGAAMILGSFASNRFIRKMKRESFQRFVTILLILVGLYMIAAR
jgi:uncharacterized membrane protein YfcA